jgi:hypothetical protein
VASFEVMKMADDRSPTDSVDRAQHHGRPVNDRMDAEPPREGRSTMSKNDDVPPDGGYGWVCVACSAFINGNTWGVNSVSLLESG